MKTRLLLRLGVLACLGLGGLVALLWWSAPRHRITEASAEQIKNGMTEDEVLAILRVPAGIYVTDNHESAREDVQAIEEKLWRNGISVKGWLSDSALIIVQFNEHGRVEGSTHMRLSSDIFQRLRRWLRLS
jgi:hypothetical protein